ncbi:MAG: hypothetical protein FD180_4314 [Planctomycetota bacterium]|nr:MAG: hypothetical protein FD180_4314 [Planctomycetota bacterium]
MADGEPVQDGMNCNEVREALSVANEGAPPEVAGHLEACAGCRAWAAGLAALPARLAAWTAPALSDSFEAKVLASLPSTRRTPRWALVAAEFLIFALGSLAGLGAVWVFSPGRPTGVRPADPAALGGGGDLADFVTGD